jgi:hypothetical protein
MPGAEEVDTKPAFREPFRQRRCLAFQLAAKFGVGRSGGMPNAILISLTSEERRAPPSTGSI